MSNVEFLGKYLPEYYTRTDVTKCDDLFKLADDADAYDDGDFAHDWGYIPEDALSDAKSLERRLVEEAITSALAYLCIKSNNVECRWEYNDPVTGDTRYYSSFSCLIVENALELEPEVLDIQSLGCYEELRHRWVG